MVSTLEQKSTFYTFKNKYGIFFKSPRNPSPNEKVRLFSLDTFVEKPNEELPTGEYLFTFNGKKKAINFFIVSFKGEKFIAIFNSIIKNAFSNQEPKSNHLTIFSKVFSLPKVKKTISQLKKFSEHTVPYKLYFPVPPNKTMFPEQTKETNSPIKKEAVRQVDFKTEEFKEISSQVKKEVVNQAKIGSLKIDKSSGHLKPILKKSSLTFARRHHQKIEFINGSVKYQYPHVDSTCNVYNNSLKSLTANFASASPKPVNSRSTKPEDHILNVDLPSSKKPFTPPAPEKEASLFHIADKPLDEVNFDEDIFLKPSFDSIFSEGAIYIIRLSQFYPEYAVKLKRMCLNFNQIVAFSNENNFSITLYIDKDKDGFFRLLLDSKNFDLFTDVFSPYIKNLYFSAM